jgi:hypothetical protein
MRFASAGRRALILVALATACGGGGGGGDLDVEVSLDPSAGPPGTTIDVTAAGCTSIPEPWMMELGNGLEDATGEKVAEIEYSSPEHGTLTVPDGAEAGSYSVTVNCPSGTTEDGSINVANSSATFEVTG